MKKTLLILLTINLMFSCGEDDQNNNIETEEKTNKFDERIKKLEEVIFSSNIGFIRLRDNISKKNQDIYNSLDYLTNMNPQKYAPYRDLLLKLKFESESLIKLIQQMKYSLVLETDGSVCLGKYPKDNSEQEIIKTTKSFDELTRKQQLLTIVYLKYKDNMNISSNIFYIDNGNGLSSQLKRRVESYRSLLVNVLNTSQSTGLVKSWEDPNNIRNAINKTFKLDDNYGPNQNELWESYFFNDMPSIAVLTTLSKLQSDVKDIESRLVSFLLNNIEADSY